MTAELLFVKAVPITPDNAVEHLLYAVRICALLKEDVMNYIVENKNTILDSKMSFDDIPLMRDLMAAEVREKRRHLEENIDMWIGGGEDHFKNALRISELRWKAHERGL